MICRRWRERDLVKGPPSTQIPARSVNLQWCGRSSLLSRQAAKKLLRVFRDAGIERTAPVMVPALAQVGSNIDRRTSGRKYSRKSQSLGNVSGAGRRRLKKEGVQEIRSRTWCNCGGLRHSVFGRARFPGCADVVLLGRLHRTCV